jgi:hypothetical protein
VAASLAAGTCLVAGTGPFRASQGSSNQTLAAWLEQHHLSYGLSGYWNAAPTTIYSGESVQVRQIVPVPGGFAPDAWGAKKQWYEAASHDANFVITQDDDQLHDSPLTPAVAEASFGKPTAVYQVDGFTILIYPYNLLTRGKTLVLKPGA